MFSDFIWMQFIFVVILLGHLVSHRRSHFGERPYGCTECTKKFCEKGNMLRHMRKHHPNVPLPIIPKTHHSNIIKVEGRDVFFIW